MRGGRFLIALALFVGSVPVVAEPSPEVQARNVRIFDRAWTVVGRRYWDRSMHGLDWPAERARFLPRARAAEDPRALYAAINAMLGRLGDSHVYATSPERRDFMRGRRQGAGEGEQAGFGFDAYQTDDRWVIRSVQPGGPAAAAGMQIGWTLLSVDGRPVDIDTHFGEGDTATLVLADENGGRHTLSLRGAVLAPEPSRRARRIGGMLLLAFDQFASGEDRWIARELMAAPDLRGVILDLRENEGGEAGVLDRVAALFVAERQVVLRLRARRTQDERTTGRHAAWLGPLAVLVGPRTASAAEALAAFLDESGRAATLGERTAGALTAGSEHALPDGGRLTVAEQDIRTPRGARLEGVGFVPRSIVTATLTQRRRGLDPVLEAAIARLGATQSAGGVSTSMSPPSAR
jgi:carboxyl-terminal processing protease